jgi:hypothetical protein
MLTRSSRRHIRAEKARIRRATADAGARAQKMAELYAKFGLTVAGDRYAR